MTFLLAFLLLSSFTEVNTLCSSCLSFGAMYLPGNLSNENVSLKGYNLSTISVANFDHCFDSCITSDCRCMSFNFKKTPDAFGQHECELNYETRKTQISALVPRPGYTYHDIISQVERCGSFSCENRCCNSKPCFNNGICVDLCDDIQRMKCICTAGYEGRLCQRKSCLNNGTCVHLCDDVQRMKCSCPIGYVGRYCERKRDRTCQDVLRRNPEAVSGLYPIFFSDNRTIDIYCDFTDANYTVWALVNSFSFQNNLVFNKKPLSKDFPQAETNMNFEKYRLSFSKMNDLKEESTHWRATCNFQVTNKTVYNDYIRGKFTAVSILQNVSPGCNRLEYIHIESLLIKCIDCTAFLRQTVGTMIHLKSKSPDGCDVKSSVAKDYFGRYERVDPKFGCVLNSSSTTQWWIGGLI